jgi:hypothetical protein
MNEKLKQEQTVKSEQEKKSMQDESHYEFVKKTIDGWPSWKKEINEKLLRLTT